MLLNPDKQKKAQIEIDAVTDGARLPDFKDMQSLPYVFSILKETLRWNVVIPMSEVHLFICNCASLKRPSKVARPLSTDDDYNGMKLPNGTYILGNLWYV